ncbi:ketoacyl-ACP synthase III [Clostridium fermenticellae]|uniref:Beta-ketoacyl-[acyl-carrier-protein] synthase III n=1 Tax=Clostridium fermenticellae TaxID=2068654 RepID=A0A386H6E3_9CLOT|nr:beta-ketoacyl-ACP synthase III [Clostridium fermenticellae]AYD41331.1 ketoacyl-ACP synthase III [Clostridium fermenticellae]
MNSVRIIGTGSYVPPKIVSNDDLSCVVETNDEWIKSRTGIRERRISEGENTSSMASKAALNALKAANVKPEEIDIIIVATATPDNFIPSTACVVQDKIGAVNATCFDISAACSGFVYGLNIASQFIRTGYSKTILVIGAETLSKILDWSDRSTCILFGDGAGAAVVTVSDRNKILSLYSGSVGSKGRFLVSKAVPVENLYVESNTNDNHKTTMDGREIFKFGVKTIINGVKKLLEDAGCTEKDIKYIVPHQANCRIIEFAARELGIDKNKFYLNLDRYGNTSAASIGIALDEIVRKHLIEQGDKILLIGFGGGLTYGGMVIEW